MEATARAQRRRASRNPADASVIRIEMKDGMGHPRWVTADLIDITDGGFGLSLMTPVVAGASVIVRGKLGEHRTGNIKVGVRWCFQKPDGMYRAGLEFLDSRSAFTPHSQPDDKPASPANPDALDCYEVMQLSPNADADTIARVYRMLALRYHPDNAQTGNSEMFVRLSEAHEILNNPEKRAAYDVRHGETKRLRWKIFDQAASSVGSEGEKRKRQGILALLYTKTVHDPDQAEMSIQLIEDLLGCPREHLQAALWYLKGKNYIRRSDNGRYSITITGFEVAEAEQFTPAAANRQLPEASPAN